MPKLPALAAPDERNGVRIATLLELGATKAAVVQVRAEAKDYLDIDAMLESGEIDLPTMLSAARRLYPDGFTSLPTLKALTFYDDGDLATLSRAVRDRLAAAVAAVDIASLDRPS